jgi:hypothetical protein
MNGLQASLRVGSSLVDIAAVTALIGSNTAESLALGNRGAPGLAWSALSIFGTLSVTRACISAATPGWLRETIGVRNAGADSAVGLRLDLDSKYMNREDMARKNIEKTAQGIVGEPKWVNLHFRKNSLRYSYLVSCGFGSQMKSIGSAFVLIQTHSRWCDVYSFDSFTATQLNSVPWSHPGERLKVCITPNDPGFPGPRIRGDLAGLVASLLKAIEICVLWRVNATILGWLSALPWLYFFFCGTMLLLFRLSRGYRKDHRNGRIDIIAGELPTARTRGGRRKILLDAPRNCRNNYLWTAIWIIGALTGPISLVACYISLGNQTAEVIYIWAGFQALWLLLRSVFYHIAEGPNAYSIPTGEEQFEKLDPYLRRKVSRLVVALAKYQMHAHPRGSYSYHDDRRSLSEIDKLLRSILTLPAYPIQEGHDGKIKVRVLAVLGDALFLSAAWILGSQLSGMDVYDCCVLILRTGDTNIIVPAARALCHANPKKFLDIENTMGQLRGSKGSSNFGPQTVQWRYWIPSTGGAWLHVCSKNMHILGDREAEVLTAAQVSVGLQIGGLGVSIQSVTEVEELVRTSQEAMQLVLDVFQIGGEID